MKPFPRVMTHSSGAPLVLDATRLLLAFQGPVARKAVEQALKERDLRLEPDAGERAVPTERVNHSDRRFWVQGRQALSTDECEAIEAAMKPLGLAWLGPVYRMSGEDGRRALIAPAPDVLVVKLRDRGPGDEPASVGSLLAAADGRAPAIKEIVEKSRYLNGWRYFVLGRPEETSAFELRSRLLESQGAVADVQFETMPLLVPTANIPNDTLFAQQWDMTRIQAGGPGTTGWDISTGASTVVVCVLDEGCDLTHPDLVYAGQGLNLGSMLPPGSPTGNHGTACAGIVAGAYGNMLGVTGVAGSTHILPVAFDSWSDVEVAAGINWATDNGAQVISMSFGSNGWSHAIIDPAIQYAFDHNLVMCVATHNYNGAITYPATNPLVIAVGASDEIDNRKSPASPDGESWGSDFGPEISVVAPGVHIPTTDRQGADGYNTASGVGGDYFLTFNGTSSATPHVAGLAALVLSINPTLSNLEVRGLIERNAEKVGTVPYADTPGHPNGTWNQEMGYGRINVLRTLDFADVIIRDAPGDTGVEPYAGGNFWDFSDIVVRINDDNVFNPGNSSQSKNVERGQANYIYVRVTNTGPRPARNVTVGTRITPYVGLQFVYPQDWTQADAMHVSPTPVLTTFADVPPGGSVIAKFRIEAAQTDTLYGWENDHPWHPCLLAAVNADNDYAFATAPLTGDPISARRNNLAQRNLSVIDVLASAAVAFPFVAGNLHDGSREIAVVIDRTRLPAAMPLLLALDDDGAAFPLVDFAAGTSDANDPKDDSCGGMVFLDRTRIRTRLGCCVGDLTLEKGSRFDCPTRRELGRVTVDGGDVIVRGDKRFVQLTSPVTTVRMEKAPGRLYPLSLHTTIPAAAQSSDKFQLQVAQQDARGATVGGAAVVYSVR